MLLRFTTETVACHLTALPVSDDGFCEGLFFCFVQMKINVAVASGK
jgi:hypothetical protein